MKKIQTVLYNCRVVDVVNGAILPNLHCIAISTEGTIDKLIPCTSENKVQKNSAAIRDAGDKVTEDLAQSLVHQHYCSVTVGSHAENGASEAVKKSASLTTKILWYDCNGNYVLPGFIDCHVHVTAFTASFATLEQTSPSYVTARTIPALKEMLHRGFTTVRDAGGADHGLAQAIREGHIVGPRLLFCGKALSQTGGHGDMRIPGNFAKALSSNYELCQCCAGLGRVVDGVAEVRRAVRDEIRKGATHIKVMAGGGVSSPTDRITSTQFSKSELEAIVEEATAANLPVLAHAYTPRAIINAVKAGVSSIEHGNLLNEEAAQLMAKAGCFLVPTLVTYECLIRDGLQQGLLPEMVQKVYDVLDAGKQSIQIAHNAGVVMCYGTDCLADMRRSQLREFQLLHDAGLSIAECLRTATCHAAKLVQHENQLGVVQEKAIADLLVVSKNPFDPSLELYNDWDNHCVAMFQGGNHVLPAIKFGNNDSPSLMADQVA